MSFITNVENVVDNALHPIKQAVDEAVAKIKAEAAVEEQALASEVRQALAQVRTDIAADAPPALQELADDAVKALEAVLARHGL